MNQEQIEDQKYYVGIWKAALAGLLNWSDQQIDDWIQKNRRPWADGWAHYVHEPPEFWVIPALFSNSLSNRIGAVEVAKLRREILGAIDEGNPKWFSREYDWSSARSRINKLLLKYGATESELL